VSEDNFQKVEKETSSCIRVFSTMESVAEINELLGLEASKWDPLGSTVSAVSAQFTGKARSHWVWQSSVSESLPPQQHVSLLLQILEDRATFLSPILKQSGEIEIYLGYGSYNGQGGLTLPPALLYRLGQLSIGFSMDVHLFCGNGYVH